MSLDFPGDSAVQHPEFAGVRAMFARYHEENELMKQLSGEFLGEPYQRPAQSELFEPFLTGVTKNFLTVLETEARLDLGVLVSDGIGELSGEVIEELVPADSDLDPSVTRALITSTFNSVMGIFDQEQIDNIAARHIRDYRLAQGYAAAHGVQIPDVFAKDAVYEDYMRSSRSAQTYVDETTEYIDAVQTGPLIEAIIDIDRAQAGAERAMTPHEVAALEEEYAEMRTDPKLISELSVYTTRFKAGAAYAVSSQVERFWGEGALDELTPDSWQHLEDLQAAYTPPAPLLFPSLSSLLNPYPEDRDEN